jgi:hypothetical protein
MPLHLLDRLKAAATQAGTVFSSSSPAYHACFSDFGKAASTGIAVGTTAGFILSVASWAFTVLAGLFPSPLAWGLFSGLAWATGHAAGLFVAAGSHPARPELAVPPDPPRSP